MYYTWKHYTKDQILGKLENLWDRAVVEGIGFEVFDFSRGTFIDGEDVYIFVLNHKDEDHRIGGKIDEEFDEWDVSDEHYNLSDGYTVDFLRPNIIEGDDDEIAYLPIDVSKFDIDEIASELIQVHGFWYSLQQLEESNVYPYSVSLTLKDLNSED